MAFGSPPKVFNCNRMGSGLFEAKHVISNELQYLAPIQLQLLKQGCIRMLSSPCVCVGADCGNVQSEDRPAAPGGGNAGCFGVNVANDSSKSPAIDIGDRNPEVPTFTILCKPSNWCSPPNIVSKSIHSTRKMTSRLVRSMPRRTSSR